MNINLLLVFFFVAISKVSSQCSVTFFWDNGYLGSSLKMTDGQNYADLRVYGFNDAVSSIRFAADPNTKRKCVVRACWNVNCDNGYYGGSTYYIYDHASVGFANDQFSALYVTSYDPTNDPWALFCKSCSTDNPDYQWFIIAQQTSTGFNDIFMADFEKNNIGNDALSRVILGANAAVDLYKDDDYGNIDYIIIGAADITCLANGWNDVASSAKLYNLANGMAFPTPVGQWVLQTSGGSGQLLSYSITYGYTTDESNTSEQSLSASITTSIEAGIEFDGFSAKTSVSSTFSSTIASSIAKSITKSTSVTCTATCQPNTCTTSVTYLYSWSMSFTRPWDTIAQTTLNSCNYFCRCTSTPPACPLLACLDNDPQCNNCKPYS